MALAKDRLTPRREVTAYDIGVATTKTLYAGGIACLNASGYATPGATATGLKALGISVQKVSNPGADGDLSVRIERGCYRFKNSASGDLIAITDIGATAYIVDDETVAKTNGSSTRSAAGIIRDVDAQGVWIEF